MHPHGVQYDHDNSGADPVVGQVPDSHGVIASGGAVPYGAKYTYSWCVSFGGGG